MLNSARKKKNMVITLNDRSVEIKNIKIRKNCSDKTYINLKNRLLKCLKWMNYFFLAATVCDKSLTNLSTAFII